MTEDLKKLNVVDTIQSWAWRIKKAKLDQKTFAANHNIAESLLSEYINDKKMPSLKTFENIENALRELGV
jgi:transcriptional regulator with XRE-family HTH domain